MKKILFITPTFFRTGSEMVLWYLITNLKSTNYKIMLFSVHNGELLEALPNHISRVVSYKYSGKWQEKAFRGILKLCGVNPLIYQLKQINKRFKADLWFVNTIMIPDAHLAAKELNVKIATYIHEMDNAFTFIKDYELERIVNLSNFYIGCSEIVVKKLAELGLKDIKLQNSFINEDIIKFNGNNLENLKNKLGIKPNEFVWIISGAAHYMKGYDQILQVMDHFIGKPVKIIWIGSHFETGLDYYIKTVAEKKYSKQLIFTGPLSNDYYEHIAIGDGLLILSREETFSLVMLEAAYLHIPIVAYKSGIISKFIEDGMGKVVNQMDIEQLCNEMEWVQANPLAIDKKKLKIRASEFTVKNQTPLFEKLLEEILQNDIDPYLK